MSWGITPDGIYTAPPTVPTAATVTIRAISLLFPEFSAEATVTIVKEATDFAVAAVSVRFGTPQPGPGTISHAVSVSFGTPQVGSAPGTVTNAVSVSFGIPSVTFPPGTLTHAVSVGFGTPPVGSAPGTVTHAVSVVNAPVILRLAPDRATAGTTIPLTITGANLTGATGLAFAFQGTPDAAISVSNLSVNPAGDELTATITVGAEAALGPRTVMVRTPSGTSTGASTGSNVFTVTAP